MKKALLILAVLSRLLTPQAQSVSCSFDSIMLSDTSRLHNLIRSQIAYRSMDYGKINYGTFYNMSQKRSSTPKAKYILPTVVHVIHLSTESEGTGSNIYTSQIQHQLSWLNTAFAKTMSNGQPVGVQLCLATKMPDGSPFSGIIRHTVADNKCQNNEVDMKALMKAYQLDPDQYTNIFIVKGFYDGASKTSVHGIGLPKGVLDGTSGIIMSYDWFGSFYGCPGSCNLDSNSTGNSFVHELGHYLGLYHTFMFNCAGMQSNTCSVEGDLCCDTRPEDGPHYFCGVDLNTCSEDNDAQDPWKNYMSYRNDCMSEFTPDQATLIESTLQSSYANNIEVDNIKTTGANGCNYHTALFSVDKNTICDTGTFLFTALDLNRYRYTWKIVNAANNTTIFQQSYYNSSNTFTWKATSKGRYTITLTNQEGQDTIAYTRKELIEVFDCKTKLQSENGNWYFGKYAGMNFTNTSPVIDNTPNSKNPSAINTLVGSSCQSTSTGRLLFYTTPSAIDSTLQVFNKLHDPLLRGNLVIPNSYPGNMNILSIPRPYFNGRHYYLVTFEGAPPTTLTPDRHVGAFYSILDTALDAGKGGMVKRSTSPFTDSVNMPILPPPSSPENKLKYLNNSALWSGGTAMAIPKCNGQDYWLIIGAMFYNDVDSATPYDYATRKHLVYSVQKTGIFYHHIDTFTSNTIAYSGRMNVSPNGRWIMSAGVLFSFDKSTGTLTQKEILTNASIGEYCTFSPNSNVLYYTKNNKQIIYQKDLTNPNRPVNQILLPHLVSFDLQLAPNDKIYIGNENLPFLSVINYPNEMNSTTQSNACGFQYKGFLTKQGNKGGLFKLNLPNVLHAKKESNLTPEIIVERTSCNNVKLTTSICCDASYVWNFGDGSPNGNGLETTHTFVSHGQYTITLTTNNRTVTRKIKIGIDSTDVSGSFNICDTARYIEYNVKYYNKDYKYKWTPYGGVLKSSSTFNYVNVKWNKATCSLSLVATSYEGCVDSIVKSVNTKSVVTNNTINMQNKYCGYDTIYGSNPSGGDGTYNYIWQSRKTGTTEWTNLVYNKTSDYFPDDYNESYEYSRIVYSNSCSYTSNVIQVTPFSTLNNIGKNLSLCGIVSTGTNLDTISGIKYQWQRSTDSLSWNNVTNDTLKSINHTSSLGTFYFYRRKASIGSCVNYSNVIYAGGNKIKKQPESIYICPNGTSTQKFKFTFYNERDTGYSFRWYYRNPGGSTWFIIGGESERELFAINAYYYGSGTSVRCKIVSNCGDIYSDIVYVWARASLDTILTQPNKLNVLSSGTSLTLKCKITRDSSKSYQWQSSNDNGKTWFNMKGRVDSNLILTGLNSCQNKKTYRVKITNYCGTGFYSDTANVKVTGLSANNQDYWMKDAWNDNGIEPYTDSGNIYQSVDLFASDIIRTKKPSPMVFEPNPIFKTYVHALVRNKGSQPALGGKLYLYWTIGSTGEKWTDDWTDRKYQNYYFNPDSINVQPNGGWYPKGGEINTLPITIGTIAPGDSVMIHYEWKNIPNPIWYKNLSQTENFGAKKLGVCLLARIETCEEPDYGMTYKEVKPVQRNVYKNNNIVTRNLWVRYLGDIVPIGPQTNTRTNGNKFKDYIGTRNLVEGGVTILKNMKDVLTSTKICVELSDVAYLTKADMFIVLSDKLMDAWKQGGSHYSGFERIDNNVFRVLVSSACLSDISVDTGFAEGFITYFAYKDIDDRFPDDAVYNSTIYQYGQTNNLEGGVIYELRDNPVIPEPVNLVPYHNPDNSQLNQVQSKANSTIKAYPNPTNSSITVEWSIELNKPYTIQVYDIVGTLVFSKVIRPNEMGRYIETINMESHSSGVYTISVNAEGFKGITKMVLIK